MSGSAPVGHLADGTPYYAPLGQLPYDPDEDRVQCHLCGEWFCQVGGSHLLRKHGWTMDEYRRAFGLPKRISVCSVGVSERRRQKILPRIAEGGDFAATTGRFKRDRQSAKTGGANAAKARIGGGVRQPASELPKLVAEWHQQRNRGLSLDALGVSSPQRAWWRCESCGQVWEASVRSRTNGSGCPRCRHENDLRILREASQRNSARARRERSLAIVRPDLLPEWHPARNGELDPTAIAASTATAAWWQCAQCGHEWQARIANRVYGSGCPACAGRHTPAARSLAVKYPGLLKEWDLTRNADLDPYALGPGSGRRVWWRCESCGHEWQAQIQSRARQGTGCPQCARVAVGALRGYVRRERSLGLLRPDLACALHPTRNGDLDAYRLGASSHRKVWWQCQQCEHEWQAEVYTRASSSGRCPNCHGHDTGLHSGSPVDAPDGASGNAG